MVFARRQSDMLRRCGLEVACFHLASRTSLVRLVREFVRFRAQLRAFRPEVIHAQFGTMTAMFAVLAAGNCPVVITYRGSDLNHVPTADGWRARLGRGLSQLAALGAARIVCVSDGLKRQLWWRRDRVTVLPSGVDAEAFRPMPRSTARRELGWIHPDPVVLFNAGHDPRNKRQDLAESAFALLRQEIPEARLEVVATQVPPDRMPLYMNAADCLLVTSDAEGSPTVVQEALACNLPVVSVAVGDVPERLRGVRPGGIVARDPEPIARALQEVLRTGQRSNGRARLPEICGARIAGDLVHIYREAAAESARRREPEWNSSLC
jgi:glycosyltransferase involved in cell wall biosynthesis